MFWQDVHFGLRFKKKLTIAFMCGDYELRYTLHDISATLKYSIKWIIRDIGDKTALVSHINLEI